MTYQDKLIRLEKHIQKYENFPRQRSDRWYKGRCNIIGGSDIAIIMGVSRFKSRRRLLAEKIESHDKTLFPYTDKFSDVSFMCERDAKAATAVNWGTLFEGVTELILEIDLNTKVVGSDFWIPGDEYGMKMHYNSPDGYAVIALDEDNKLIHRIDEDKPNVVFKYKTVLIEIKSPFMRKLKEDIPDMYLPQVHSGIALSQPVTSGGLYVDCVYRFTKAGDMQLTNPFYLRDFHKARGEDYGYPILLGRFDISGGKCGDLSLNAEQIPYILADIVSGKLTSKIHIYIKDTVPIDDIIPPDDVGWLCWKLFEIKYHIVKKNMEFIKRIQTSIHQFIAEVAESHSASNV